MNNKYRYYYLNKNDFRRRFFKMTLLAAGMFSFSLLTGVLGYHYIVDLSWIDAFLNASMILGGMGVISDLDTDPEKIFAACYALFSGVAFLSSMAVFIAPILHRVLHRFHLDSENREYSDVV